MCVAQGFPTSVFFVNEDLTRADGAIVCRRVDAVDVARIGWKVVRALRLLLSLPWPV